MGQFVKLFIMLFVWHLFVFTLRMYDAHNGLIINNMHIRLCDANPFINQVTFCILGTPICAPFMPNSRNWIFMDPYSFIIPLKIMVCL